MQLGLRTAALAAALVTATAAPAGAAHWPQAGGDAARAGEQPLGTGAAPVRPAAGWTSAGNQGDGAAVVGGAVVTAGSIPGQRVVTTNADATVTVRRLDTGAEIGTAALDGSGPADADAVTGDGGALAPADLGGGFAIAVLNDDDAAGDDVVLALVRLADATVVQRLRVAGTEGHTVSAAPLVAAAGSSRFVVLSAVEDAPDPPPLSVAAPTQRLFRVAVGGTAAAPTLGTTTPVDVLVGATASTLSPAPPDETSPRSAPALVSVEGVPHVVVGTADVRNNALDPGETVQTLRTFRLDTLAPGPASDDLGGAATTPSAAGGVLWATVDLGATHQLVRLAPSGDDLVATTAPAEAGDPGPGVAVGAGRVLVPSTTGLRSYEAATPATAPALLAGDFSTAVPAVGGGLAYAAQADGTPVVAAATTLAPLAAGPAGFEPVPGHAGAPAGQPALSRGWAVFGSSTGTFAYRDRDTVAPTGGLRAPAAGATLAGPATFAVDAADARGVERVVFRIDGAVVGEDTTGQGSPFVAPGARFTLTRDVRGLAPGTHSWSASASDGTTTVGLGSRTFRVANRPPTVRLADRAAVRAGVPVTFSAAAADPDARGLTFRWDLDGDGDFERTTGTTPRVTATFAGLAERRTVGVRVADPDGGTASDRTTFQVTRDGRPNAVPVAAFTVLPLRPGAGDTLALDASGSRDPDGEVVAYAWDLDGDGRFGGTGDGERRVRTSAQYFRPGPQRIALRVTDDAGFSTVVARTIDLAPEGDGGDTAPTARIDAPRTAAARRGVRLVVEPDADVTVLAELLVSRRAARRLGLRSPLLGETTTALGADDAERVRVRLRRGVARRLAGRRVPVLLRLTLTDIDGDEARLTRRLVLRG